MKRRYAWAVAMTSLTLLAAACGEDDQQPAAATSAVTDKLAGLEDPRPADWSSRYPGFAAPAGGDGSLARVQREGVLRVCAQSDGAPFVSRDPSSNEVVGFEPEIMRVLAETIGVAKVEYVDTDFGSLIASVEGGQCDVGMSGLGQRSDRTKANVRFTWPYVRLGQAILVKSDAAIQQVEELAGENIGVGGGEAATEALEARRFAKEAGAGTKVSVFEGPAACYQALLNDTVAACWDNTVGAKNALEKVKGIKVALRRPYSAVGDLAPEATANPFYLTTAAPITNKRDGDLNIALAKAGAKLVQDGTQQRILERYGLWDPTQAEFVRPDA